MNELYQISECSLTANGVSARIQINPAHEIFQGHFPGQPVMPGVCMMELVGAVAERKTGHSLRISSGPVIKFLNMVDPRKTPELQVEMTLEENQGTWLAVGRLFHETLVFVRFQLALIADPRSSAVLPGTF